MSNSNVITCGCWFLPPHCQCDPSEMILQYIGSILYICASNLSPHNTKRSKIWWNNLFTYSAICFISFLLLFLTPSFSNYSHPIVNSMKQNCYAYQICRNESWVIPIIDRDVQNKNLCTLWVGMLTSTITFEKILVLSGKNEDTWVLWSSSSTSGSSCVCVFIYTPVYVFSVLFPIICNTTCTGFAHFHGPVSGLLL